MIDFLLSEDTFLGFCIGVSVMLLIVLITGFIGVATDIREDAETEEYEMPVYDETSVFEYSLMEETCPYVEGTVSAEAWHKRTGR